VCVCACVCLCVSILPTCTVYHAHPTCNFMGGIVHSAVGNTNTARVFMCVCVCCVCVLCVCVCECVCCVCVCVYLFSNFLVPRNPTPSYLVLLSFSDDDHAIRAHAVQHLAHHIHGSLRVVKEGGEREGERSEDSSDFEFGRISERRIRVAPSDACADVGYTCRWIDLPDQQLPCRLAPASGLRQGQLPQ